jgi:hypothetical protein
VLFSLFSRRKRAQVFALALGILLFGIQSVFGAARFSNHASLSSKRTTDSGLLSFNRVRYLKRSDKDVRKRSVKAVLNTRIKHGTGFGVSEEKEVSTLRFRGHYLE